MTDQQRFTEVMAKMMGYKTYSNFISAVTENSEIAYGVRKWWAENLPEAWEKYLEDIMHTDVLHQQEYKLLLNAQLDWRNLWKWMKKNQSLWNEKECPKCQDGWIETSAYNETCTDAKVKTRCQNCNGTGRIARWELGELLGVQG